jgi:hypothetical protein
MSTIKGIKWQDKTVTVTLTELETRAIRSAICWAEMLEKAGEIELFDYQKEAFNKLKEL